MIAPGQPIRAEDFTGLILMWGGAAAPSGWLLCNGQAVSRTTYEDLFDIIGTAYGVGDGSTTFNVPDLRGRVPVGKDAGTFANLGDTGGEEEHTLILDEIPAHTHALTKGNSSEPLSGSNVQDTTASDSPGNTGSAGGGDPHNNLQPYQVVNFIIKT